MKNFYFDHCYTDDKNHKFLKNLKKRGFTVQNDEVEHPQKHFCRFIPFKPKKGEGKQYLEFVNAKDQQHPIKAPGISFGYKTNLEKLYKRLTKTSSIAKYFIHKNYFWKKGSKSRLPGWNFLGFKNTGIRNIHLWMTEYEPLEDKTLQKRRNKIIHHKNSVEQIIGFELDISERGALFFSKLLGRKVKKLQKIDNGVLVLMNFKKVNKFRAIVLKCKCLETFIKVARPDEVINYRGVKAAKIINPSGMWDMIAVENLP